MNKETTHQGSKLDTQGYPEHNDIKIWKKYANSLLGGIFARKVLTYTGGYKNE